MMLLFKWDKSNFKHIIKFTNWCKSGYMVKRGNGNVLMNSNLLSISINKLDCFKVSTMGVSVPVWSMSKLSPQNEMSPKSRHIICKMMSFLFATTKLSVIRKTEKNFQIVRGWAVIQNFRFSNYRSLRYGHSIRSHAHNTKNAAPSEFPLPQTSTLRSRRRLANMLVAGSFVFIFCWSPHVICLIYTTLAAGESYSKMATNYSLLLGKFK